MDKFVGKRLDARYEIREIIGVGGMAVVYKAYDCIDDRIVAIKILKEEFVRNSEFLNRFRNESKAIAVLSHPNIVKVIDVSFGDNFQYIVMEYIDGITLKEFMQRQGAISWKDALYFTVQILRALQHAHDKGIVHRDVKPQNIMLLSDGTIKVTDFGIARFARSSQQTLTDKAIGSVHYISPEQARGDNIDEKADLYSVGVMMYEMLTGKLPFDGGNAVSIALMHMNNEPEAPRKLNPNIPVGLEQIVLRSMRKKPAYRYHSDAEIMHDLEQVRRDPTVTFNYDEVKYVDDSPTRYVSLGSTTISSTPAGIPVSKPAETTDAAKKISMLYGDDLYGAAEQKAEYEVLTNSADDDDYDDDPPKKSSIVPILAGIATVVVIALAIILIVVFKNFNNTGDNSGSVRCPQLVGSSYEESTNKYKSINIIISGYDYSDEYAFGVIMHQSEEEGKFLRKSREVNVVVSLGKKTKTLPDIYKMNENNATGIIEAFGLEFVLQYEYSNNIEKGTVVRTEPKRGSPVDEDTKVTIIVSKGKQPVMVEMPEIVGVSRQDAEKLLKSKGLKLGKVSSVDSLMPEGYVVEQKIEKGTSVEVNTAVDVLLSTGKPPVNSTYSVTFTVTVPTNTEVTGNIYRLSATLAGVTQSHIVDKSADDYQEQYTFSFSTTQESGTIIVNVDGTRYQEWYYERDYEPKLSKQYSLNYDEN